MKRIAKHIALIMAFVSCFLSFTSYAFAQSDNNNTTRWQIQCI